MQHSCTVNTHNSKESIIIGYVTLHNTTALEIPTIQRSAFRLGNTLEKYRQFKEASTEAANTTALKIQTVQRSVNRPRNTTALTKSTDD